MQGNARKMEGNGGEYQGNIREAAKWKRDAGECKDMPGGRIDVCKVPGECREMPVESMGGYKCQGMQGNVMESVRNARGIQGDAGEWKGDAWEWVQSARGMQGNAGECLGNIWKCSK